MILTLKSYQEVTTQREHKLKQVVELYDYTKRKLTDLRLGGDIFQEGDGVNFLEGGQVLMLSPEKIQELHNMGVKEVACSVPGEEYKISLPTIGEY